MLEVYNTFSAIYEAVCHSRAGCTYLSPTSASTLTFLAVRRRLSLGGQMLRNLRKRVATSFRTQSGSLLEKNR